MKKLTYGFLLLLCFAGFSQNNTIFNQANAFYNAGRYTDAIEAYQAILDTQRHSAALYFNLGNAYYKSNRIAPSIYYYEKALLLAPNDSDIKNNLALAKKMTIDRIDVAPQIGMHELLNKVTSLRRFDDWAKAAIGSIFCFVIAFLIYKFVYTTYKKRLAFIWAVASLMSVCITLFLAFNGYRLDKADNPAIIFSEQSTVRSEPNSRSEVVFTLHEGTKVQVLGALGHWKKIKLSDGRIGWILNRNIKQLKAFASKPA